MNQIHAYEELHRHEVLGGFLGRSAFCQGSGSLIWSRPRSSLEAEHPVVRTHDETGQRALYVCRAFTRQFRDWSRQESKVLLDYLYEHCVRPEYQARHQWQAGDLVMWDNRCLLHYAVHDHGDDPRLIHRLQVREVLRYDF